MEQIQLQIIMLDSNSKEIKENIGYVNPAATDAQLFELAKKFCDLTTNSFIRVDKIVTTSLESGD